MIEYVTFKGVNYPKFQAEGFAAKFAFPFAKEVCKGVGYDIGCKKEEWAFPGAMIADIELNGINADNLPCEDESLDYIFSSHMLEHYNGSWSELINYWLTKLKKGGVLFLYLPNCDIQVYWRPWHNKKHIHYFNAPILARYFEDTFDGMYFISATDPNASFYVIAEKP